MIRNPLIDPDRSDYQFALALLELFRCDADTCWPSVCTAGASALIDRRLLIGAESSGNVSSALVL